MRAIRTGKRLLNSASQYPVREQDIHRQAADLIASWEASLERAVPLEKKKYAVKLKPGPNIPKARNIKATKTFKQQPKTLSLKEKLFLWLSRK